MLPLRPLRLAPLALFLAGGLGCMPAATTAPASGATAPAAAPPSACDRIDRRQREALAAMGSVRDVPAVFRRCQFLKNGAVGLVPIELDGTAISHQRQFTYRLVVEANTEFSATSSLRKAPGATATTYLGAPKTTETPEDLVVRDGRSGALEAAFVAVRSPNGLSPLTLPGGSPAGEGTDLFAPLFDRSEAAKRLVVPWQEIRWQSPTHLLTYRLPDLETVAPIPYGGASTERLVGVSGTLCIDDDFSPCRPVDFRYGLAESCRAIAPLASVDGAGLWAAAECARLGGAATEEILKGVATRCEQLAKEEEPLFLDALRADSAARDGADQPVNPRDLGEKNKPAKPAAGKPEARPAANGRTEPPPHGPRRPPKRTPGACFAIHDRLWNYGYTAQIPRQRPTVTLDRAWGDTLEHLAPLLATP